MFKKNIKRIENIHYHFLTTNIARDTLEILDCKYNLTSFNFKA
jgi:hypothetical protein